MDTAVASVDVPTPKSGPSETEPTVELTEPRLVTQSEYAKRRGISRQAVHKAVKAGRLTAVGKMIELSTADRQWFDNTNQAQMRLPEPPPPPEAAVPMAPAPGTVTGEKARHEGFKASLTQLDLEERAGRLTDVEGVRSEQYSVARSVRDGLMNIPHELSTRIASVTGMGEEDCFDLLDDYVRNLCDKLAGEAAGT